MPEVLCTFRTEAGEEPQYFMSDSSVSLRQFEHFLAEQFPISAHLGAAEADQHSLWLNGRRLSNDRQLQDAFLSGELNICRRSPSPGKADGILECHRVLQRFRVGIPVDAGPLELIRLLPLPILQNGGFERLAQCPTQAEAVARELATCLGFSPDQLAAEMADAIESYRLRQDAPDHLEQQRLLQGRLQRAQDHYKTLARSSPELFGPHLRTLMSLEQVQEADLDTSCLQALLQSLPAKYARRFHSGRTASRFPDRLRRLACKVARRVGMPVGELLMEVEHVLATLPLVSQRMPVGEASRRAKPKRRRVRQKKLEPKAAQIARDARQLSVVHAAVCNHCNAIVSGARFKCLYCEDYDLCTTCEHLNAAKDGSIHDADHVFAKLNTRRAYWHIRRLIKIRGDVGPSADVHPPARRLGSPGSRPEWRRQRIEALESAVERLTARLDSAML